MKHEPKQIRTLTPELRSIDAEKGLVTYVASDASLDSYREVILASGWRFDLFKKNAPFVDSHNYDSIDCLLGNVVDFRVEGDELIETVKWAKDVPENSLALLGWKMTLAGYLRAVSVGFFPVKVLSPNDTAQSTADYNAALSKLNLPSGVQPVRIYAEQQQIELSACVIGANPNALAKAHKDGVLSDEDLARVGFAEDDDIQFLHECGLAAESGALRPLLRRQMAAELNTIFRKRKTTNPAPVAAHPADATRARRLALVIALEETKTHTK